MRVFAYCCFVNGAVSSFRLENTGLKLSSDLTEKTAPPTSFVWMQDCLNPFNPTTMINFDLPANSLMTLKVCNIFGRDVKTLFDGNESAGTCSVTFDGSDPPSGFYFFQPQAVGKDGGEYVSIKKMVILKSSNNLKAR